MSKGIDKNDKKQIVVAGKKGKKGLAIGVAFLLAIAVIIGMNVIPGGKPGVSFKEVQAAQGVVKIPVAEVQDGYAHYYSYAIPSFGKVNFFVLKSSDGVIRAALDTCVVCFAEKKGYHQEGDFMVCNNCGQRFPSAKINEVKGGCNPVPLERQIDGQHLVFRESDLNAGRMYF